MAPFYIKKLIQINCYFTFTVCQSDQHL